MDSATIHVDFVIKANSFISEYKTFPFSLFYVWTHSIITLNNSKIIARAFSAIRKHFDQI